jgi:hypothetical protein
VKRPILEILAVPQCSIEGWTESIRGDIIPGRPQRLCGRSCSPPAELVVHLVLLVVRPSCEPGPDGGCNLLGKHERAAVQAKRSALTPTLASTSMSSTIIGEPFQLYLGSSSAQKILTCEAVYTTHNRDFPSYATVTAQADGIHVWDVSTKLFYSSFPTKSDASAAPEPPCCSIVLRWQACHFRNTCLQSVCHGGRE